MSIDAEGHVGAGTDEHFPRGHRVDIAFRTNRGERATKIAELMSRAKPLKRFCDIIVTKGEEESVGLRQPSEEWLRIGVHREHAIRTCGLDPVNHHYALFPIYIMRRPVVFTTITI